jgi:hypothetical protein
MPTTQALKQGYRSIYEVANECRTTPAILRLLISRGVLPAEKVHFKKGVRPVNVFKEQNVQTVKDYFINRPVVRKTNAAIRKQLHKEAQLVYDISQIQEMPLMIQQFLQDKIIWGEQVIDPKTGSMQYKIDAIEFEKLIAHMNIKTITDHPRIGWCVITKKEGTNEKK